MLGQLVVVVVVTVVGTVGGTKLKHGQAPRGGPSVQVTRVQTKEGTQETATAGLSSPKRRVRTVSEQTSTNE